MYKTLNKNEVQNHHISTNLQKLYANPDISDVNFIFHENGHKKTIPAHKSLLAVASQVFYKMFFGDLKETGDVNIVDATYDGFMEFLQFFYFDKFEMTFKNIGEVITMADKYDVSGLMNLCQIFLERNITIDTICWIYELALSYNQTYLMQLCEDKICTETTQILMTESFLSCNQIMLRQILKMDRLGCDEEFVYKRAMAWAEGMCLRTNLPVTMENKKIVLDECFQLIRFPTMSVNVFTNCLADDGNVLDTNEFLQILAYLTTKRPIANCRFPLKPRNGVPAWIIDKHIQICDRRSQIGKENYDGFYDEKDVTIFSVNERILLGQLKFSEIHQIIGIKDFERSGALTIKHCDTDEILLTQTIKISSSYSNKITLNSPIIVKPFENYQIKIDWIAIDLDDQFLFQRQCRNEVMIDGGVRFQFKQAPDLNYDNVEQTFLMKLYFKKW